MAACVQADIFIDLNEPDRNLDCIHQDRTSSEIKVCIHLLGDQSYDFIHCFTGQGKLYRLICTQCAKKYESDPEEQRASNLEKQLTQVCIECQEDIEDEGCWEGLLGKPEVLIAASQLRLEHRDVAIDELAPELTAEELGAIEAILVD